MKLLFPHQLYPEIVREKPTEIMLVEHPLYFGTDRQYPLAFHKQKLMLHRASMRNFEEQCEKAGHRVEYIPFDRWTFDLLSGVKECTIYDPTDDVLMKRCQKWATDFGVELKVLPSPNFVTPLEKAEDFFGDQKEYFFTAFYVWQRKRMGILLDEQGKPEGGQWTFDTENRKKLPKNIQPPRPWAPAENEWVEEARDYVEKHFPENPGHTKPFVYAVTHKDAQQGLDDFLQFRFIDFGPYEDALSTEYDIVFHSVLTPALNIGLLSPQLVVDQALRYAQECQVPLQSLEGFVRQIIGWREFIRLMYLREGVHERNSNFWKHTKKIPHSFWTGETGLLPVDHSIKKVMSSAYLHHIERLMVMGNIMLLCEFDPEEVYKWFMALFIDAYDWVMVPNVFAMSQYADGGQMTTKPYISGANYLKKMSNYSSGEWEETWTSLYWNFIGKHVDFFAKNPRLSMMARMWEKMGSEVKNAHVARATAFLENI